MANTSAAEAPQNIHTLLKEWAVVQRALLEGHQILLLRKGGISEDTGDFHLEADHAALFPTYAHETERQGDLQPCFGQWLHEEEEQRPAPKTLRLSAWVHITDVVPVPDSQRLLKLAPQHIWSPQFIQGRYDWEPYKPIFALIVRAYKLPNAVDIPMQRSFGGCRSWIDLADGVAVSGSVPVLPDAHFARRRELTLQLLTGQRMHV